jgi:hypothetical protein
VEITPERTKEVPIDQRPIPLSRGETERLSQSRRKTVRVGGQTFKIQLKDEW